MRLGLGLGLGVQQALGGAGGGADLPIIRRDLLQEDDFFVFLEDGTSKIVITFGTFDSILSIRKPRLTIIFNIQKRLLLFGNRNGCHPIKIDC